MENVGTNETFRILPIQTRNTPLWGNIAVVTEALDALHDNHFLTATDTALADEKKK